MMRIDAHTHFDNLDCHDALIQDMDLNGADRFTVLVIDRVDPDLSLFPQAAGLWLKAKYPDRVYLYGGLDFHPPPGSSPRATDPEGHPGSDPHTTPAPDTPLIEQLERLMAMGCDGVKLLAGKPDRRKQIGRPLDGPLFEPMLTRLEETGFPVLWHVGDPPEFWNPEAVPLWARKNQWWYDATHPPKEQIDREINAVIRRHPGLNLILPHFFFRAHRLEELARLLDDRPGYYLDLAPGVEMFHHFTANPVAARDFFIRYQDRIIYGSDAGVGQHTTSFERSKMIQKFLETDASIEVPPDDPFMAPDDKPPLQGLALPDSVLAKIYATNYLRHVGTDTPRPLDRDAATEALKRLAIGGDTAARQVLAQWQRP